MRILSDAVFLGACVVLSAFTNASQQQQTATVRGMVFDSLTMKPAVGAAVWVSGGTQMTTTDRDGRFELRGVERGKRFVEFSSPALDSLELGTLGARIDVSPDVASSVTLATPSFASVWRTLCKGQPLASSDSGIVWGAVRDASNETRLHGARTEFRWVEPQVGADKKIEMLELTHHVRSDSAGNYYACGLPVSTNFLVQASGAQSLSGQLQYRANERKLGRLDLLVSAEMVVRSAAVDSSRADSTVWISPRGTSILRGVIRDDQQRALSDAAVTVSSIDTVVRSGADGTFQLGSLPAGTHQVDVRKIGFSPATGLLHLRPGASFELALSMSSITELKGVDVKADAFRSRDRLNFEERRRSGFGHALEGKTLEGKFDLQSALSQLPNIIVRRVQGGDVAVAPANVLRPRCNGTQVYVDGVETTMVQASSIAMADFRAIEWYPRSFSAPPFYANIKYCALILFWTKQARWGK